MNYIHRWIIIFIIALISTSLYGCDQLLLRQYLIDMSDDHPAIRRSAATEIGCILENEGYVPDELLRAIHDSDKTVRIAVLTAIGRIGSNDINVIEAVKSALKSQDSSMRVRAVSTMALIGVNNSVAIDSMIGMLKDSDPDVRRKAAVSLPKMTNEDYSVKALIELLQDEDMEVREDVACTFGSFGYRSEEALKALIIALDNDHFQVRWNAISKLSMFVDNVDEILPIVEGILEGEHNVEMEYVCRETIKRLKGISPYEEWADDVRKGAIKGGKYVHES